MHKADLNFAVRTLMFEGTSVVVNAKTEVLVENCVVTNEIQEFCTTAFEDEFRVKKFTRVEGVFDTVQSLNEEELLDVVFEDTCLSARSNVRGKIAKLRNGKGSIFHEDGRLFSTGDNRSHKCNVACFITSKRQDTFCAKRI